MLSLFNRCLFVLACSILPVFSQNVTLQGGTLEGARQSFSITPDPRLILWLKADEGITLDLSGTPSVSQWADQSGYANHAFQSTKANQPEYVTNAIGGHFSVKFNGTTQFLSVTNDMVDKFVTGNDRPYSMFLFLKIMTNNNNVRAVSWSNSTNSTSQISIEPCALNFAMRQFKEDDVLVSDIASFQNASTTNSFIRLSYVCGGIPNNFGRAFTFNVKEGIGSNVGFTTLDVFCIGALNANGVPSNHFTGEICEILLYSTNSSLTLRNNVIEYFGNKYGMSTHP